MSSQYLFTEQELSALTANRVGDPGYDEAREQIEGKLMALHQWIYDEILRRHWDLQPHWTRRVLSGTYPNGRGDFMMLGYCKSELVLRLMQKKMPSDLRHWDGAALLGVRVDARGLTVEFFVGSHATADGENLRSKLTFGPPEKQALRQFCAELGGGYVFALTDALSGEDVLRARCSRLVNLGVLNASLGKYTPGVHDFHFELRLASGHPRLAAQVIADEIVFRVGQLYPLYQFASWSPRNNYLGHGSRALDKGLEQTQ